MNARGWVLRTRWLVALLTAGTSAAASAAGTADTLYLRDVLAMVAAHSAVVEASGAGVMRAEAQVLSGSVHLDPSLQLEAEAGRAAFPDVGGGRYSEWTNVYRVSLVQATSLGVRIAPFVSWAPDPGLSGTASSAGLTASVPLLRTGSRNPAATALRAARLGVDAAVLDRRHVLARELLAATLSYWDLRGEQARQEIVDDAVRRSIEVLDVVTRLVGAGERAEADRTQAAAFAADRMTERAAIVQQIWERAGRLAAVADAPIRRFVDVVFAPEGPRSTFAEFSPTNDSAAVEFALASRSDVEARRVSLRAERLLGRMRSIDLLPRLELSGSVGRSFEDGRTALPAERYLSFRLTMRGSMRNRAARGALREQSARERERKASYDRARREVRTGYAVAAAAVRHAAREVASADEALDAHRAAVASERTKLSAGFATVLDVILAEDRLTNARLAAVSARIRLGQAVARVAFEVGSVVQAANESPARWAERFLNGREETAP